MVGATTCSVREFVIRFHDWVIEASCLVLHYCFFLFFFCFCYLPVSPLAFPVHYERPQLPYTFPSPLFSPLSL